MGLYNFRFGCGDSAVLNFVPRQRYTDTGDKKVRTSDWYPPPRWGFLNFRAVRSVEYFSFAATEIGGGRQRKSSQSFAF